MVAVNSTSEVVSSGSKLSNAGSLVSLWRRWATDEEGNIAITFALMTIIVVSIVGGAVDYGRWLSARYQTQAAIDAALLAAGRTAQTTYGDATAAVNAANAYYAQMKSKLTVDDTIAFEAINSATTFTAKGSAYIQTPFLSIVRVERLPVLTIGDVLQAESTIAQGGNSGSSVEIGLMLDTTGSMAGQKLVDLKAAATDLINIVIWDDQGTYTSRVGIAPFSSTVNVGNFFQAVTNQNPNLVTHTQTTTTQTGTTPIYTYPPSCYNNGVLKNSCKNKSQYQTGSTPIYTTTTSTITDNYAKAQCVVERTGTAEFTDAVPGAGSWVKSYYDALKAAGKTDAQTASYLTCPETSEIVPLTSNKTTLHSTINGLVAANSTAGALGTAWAWYLISPEWGTIFTGSSKPDSYSKLTELGPSGQPRLQKIAILMTDGAYNLHQNASASTSYVNPKALSLCSAMKAKGIKVYTVGFDLGTDTTAKNMLSSCATDSSHFYDAASGDALKAAFRDIALKISALRITH